MESHAITSFSPKQIRAFRGEEYTSESVVHPTESYLMRSLTPTVLNWLRIIALNRRHLQDMKETFERAVLPLCANEARIIALKLLERDQEEIDHVSSCLSPERVRQALQIYDEIIFEADSALAELDNRLKRPAFSISTAA